MLSLSACWLHSTSRSCWMRRSARLAVSGIVVERGISDQGPLGRLYLSAVSKMHIVWRHIGKFGAISEGSHGRSRCKPGTRQQAPPNCLTARFKVVCWPALASACGEHW
jgi:hypothetical protein